MFGAGLLHLLLRPLWLLLLLLLLLVLLSLLQLLLLPSLVCFAGAGLKASLLFRRELPPPAETPQQPAIPVASALPAAAAAN